MMLTKQYNSSQLKEFYRHVKIQWDEDFEELEKKFHPEIYLGLSGDDVIAGAALFFSGTPESADIIEAAERHSILNKPYFGYFVVDNNLRGKGIGSEFLSLLKNEIYPETFWLVIEDLFLQKFYEKNGLVIVDEIGHEKIMKLG